MPSFACCPAAAHWRSTRAATDEAARCRSQPTGKLRRRPGPRHRTFRAARRGGGGPFHGRARPGPDRGVAPFRLCHLAADRPHHLPPGKIFRAAARRLFYLAAQSPLRFRGTDVRALSQPPAFARWRPEILHDYCQFGLLAADDGLVLACPPAFEASIYAESTAPEANLYPVIAGIAAPVVVMRAGMERNRVRWT